MNLDDLLKQLEGLTPEQYGYMGLAALLGPLTLRLLGFKMLGTLIRPLALLGIVGGLYARQQRFKESFGGSSQPASGASTPLPAPGASTPL